MSDSSLELEPLGLKYDELSAEDRKRACVYRWANMLDGKKYVGSAWVLCYRHHAHLTLLRSEKNSHHSIYFQRAWDKYGEEFFVCEVVEWFELAGDDDADDKALLAREQYWMDRLGAFGPEGYNMRPKAESNRGKKVRPESIAKRRATMAANPEIQKHISRKSADAIRGKKRPLEERQKRSEAAKANPQVMAQWYALLDTQKDKPKTPKHRENIGNSLKTSEAAIDQRRRLQETFTPEIRRENSKKGWATRKGKPTKAKGQHKSEERMAACRKGKAASLASRGPKLTKEENQARNNSSYYRYKLRDKGYLSDEDMDKMAYWESNTRRYETS